METHANTQSFFECLVRLGFNPRSIVDVGANRGQWTTTAIKYFPEANYILFDPQGELFVESGLTGNPRVQFFAKGIGPTTQTMKLSKHARDDSFSFALTTEEAEQQGREQVEAPVVALDEFLHSEQLALPDILKIDAEGWDLEVLKGAEECLANAEVVLLEAAVMNKIFANNIHCVITEMDRRGFVVFDITDLNRTTRHGALWLVELAFVRKGGKLDIAVSSYV